MATPTSTRPPQLVPPTARYAEVAARVRDAGLMDPRRGPYAALLLTNAVGLGVVLAAMLLWRDSWWLIAWAPVLAVVTTQIGFLGHDIAHRQLSRRARTCTVLGLLHANLLTGLSYGWWMDKHNAHHAHPNDLDADPDVRPGVLVFDDGQVTGRTGVLAAITRHQAWLFLPLLLLESYNLTISGIRALVRPGIRYRWVELGLIVVHLIAYLGLVAATMTWAQGVVFIAVHQGLKGVYLGLSFAPNHKGMPVLSEEQNADPFLRQVLTSRNVRGGAVTDWVLGGLNYQIEHHLFPSMPRANLARAQGIVRPYCLDRGITYVECSATHSYAEVLRHLHAVGAPLRNQPAEVTT